MGGILTNWSKMFQRVQELERLERLRDSGDINRLTKKEGLLIQREITRLEMRLSGLRKMKRVPDYVFIVDVCRETTAVNEANKLEIPVIALVDTNCDPTGIDYVIPSNDDAIRAIKLLVGKIADAALEGKATRKEDSEMVEEDVASIAAPARPSRAVKENIVLDEEIDDNELLGESTLAKLGGRRVTETEVDEIQDVKVDEE
jgi:small subunit ribosomal protein S2